MDINKMPKALSDYNKFIQAFAKAHPKLIGKELMVEGAKAWRKHKGVKGGDFSLQGLRHLF